MGEVLLGFGVSTLAPPSSRAAPRADFAVTAIRLRSLVSLKCVFGNAVTPGPARVRGWPQHVARHPSVPLEPCVSPGRMLAPDL